MAKSGNGGVFKWLAGILATFLIAGLGVAYRGRAATLDDHDKRIGKNTVAIEGIGVRVEGDDRRVSEAIERIDKNLGLLMARFPPTRLPNER